MNLATCATCDVQSALDVAHCLNLHDTYDVRWGITKVIRDFIQIFYDSVPPEQFGERITIEVDRATDCVTLRGSAKIFNSAKGKAV